MNALIVMHSAQEQCVSALAGSKGNLLDIDSVMNHASKTDLLGQSCLVM